MKKMIIINKNINNYNFSYIAINIILTFPRINVTGTYFARDASYAHQFTDKPKRACSRRDVSDSLDDELNSLCFDDKRLPGVTKKDVKSDDVLKSPAADDEKKSLKIEAPTVAETFKSELHDDNNNCLKDIFNVSSTFSTTTSTTTAFNKNDVESKENIPNHSHTDRHQEASKQSDKHTHTMILTRVYVGRHAQGKGSYRRPPLIDPSNPSLGCYDSCVNYVTNPTLFVISDVHQYYPEYVIEYTNEKAIDSRPKTPPSRDFFW